jgi:hypothetical protein
VIYYFDGGIIGRSSGRSSVGAAAYRSGGKLRSNTIKSAAYGSGSKLRDGEIVHDYTKKKPSQNPCKKNKPATATKTARVKNMFIFLMSPAAKRKTILFSQNGFFDGSIRTKPYIPCGLRHNPINLQSDKHNMC